MRKRYAVALLAAAAGLAASGCATKPVDQYYTLNFPPPPAETAPGTGLVLKVRTFRTGQVYRQERIVRRFEENRITYYDTHRWAAPVERMVTEQAIEVLRASGLFSQVLPYASATPGDLVLEGEVLAIEERTESGRRSAVVRLRARLARQAQAQTVLEVGSSCDRPVEGTRPENTVHALSRCLGEALGEMAAEMAGPVRRLGDGQT